MGLQIFLLTIEGIIESDGTRAIWFQIPTGMTANEGKGVQTAVDVVGPAFYIMERGIDFHGRKLDDVDRRNSFNHSDRPL